MALQTPGRRGLARPSVGSSPNLRASTTEVNRKASLRALTGDHSPSTPAGKMASSAELEVGDLVNVPGDMYGTVKFVGSVRGKNGKFVGVELGKEFAARGKNSGDVEGTHYFNTSIPGAGIFLPVQRAEKRYSPAVSIDSFPATPSTPSYSNFNGTKSRGPAARTPPTPALPNKFSQSVGPGARRPTSPDFKPKRPSLPRPESPLRKQPTLAPTPARNLSQSVRGGRPPLGSTPSKTSLKSSVSGRPSAAPTPRPYSRTGSRLGNRGEDDGRTPGGAKTVNGRTTSNGSVPSFPHPNRSPSRLGSAGGQEAEVQRLKAELAERDGRLNEQAASLAEMEASVKELSALIPTDGMSPGGRMGSPGEDDDKTASQLRQMLREKNEKISMLTVEFDAHRADFRSTLDSLEMASTETERVYEEQKRDLLAQIAELQEMSSSKEDFEGVASQLKQLEELVAELEEGLEESRRGEAEARGEVEFLRGEVERGRSELRREKEKAAAALKHQSTSSTASSKEIEERDDEIRGLKAIIHNLSSNPDAANGADGEGHESAEEAKRLQAALDESRLEKEELEREIEQLRHEATRVQTKGHARNESSMTERALPSRPRSDTVKPTFAEHAHHSGLEEDVQEEDEPVPEHHENGDGDVDGTYCEMCESSDHDTLDCTKLSKKTEIDSDPEEDVLRPAALSISSERKPSLPDGEAVSKPADEEKWCALCEKDGHLAFDCPEEQY